MPTVHEVRDLRDSICGHLEILAHLATIGDAEIQKEVRYALGWITSESLAHDQATRNIKAGNKLVDAAIGSITNQFNCLTTPDRLPACLPVAHPHHTIQLPAQHPTERLRLLAESMVKTAPAFADPEDIYTCVLTALQTLFETKPSASRRLTDQFYQRHFESPTPKPEGEAVTA